MVLRKFLSLLGPTVVVAALVAVGAWTFDTWRAWLLPGTAAAEPDEEGEHGHDHGGENRLRLSPQARANLGLVVAPLRLASYWRTTPIPGMVVERPGSSKRGVTATLAGIVTRINAVPGDVVRPGEELFSLRLVSEYLQNAQAQLYRTAREMEINAEEQRRLKGDDATGSGLFRARLIELGYEERRLAAAMDAHRQDLAARGLTPEQIQQVVKGRFVTETTVLAPRHPQDGDYATYEVEELRVNLGEQVQAGQSLCVLAYHQSLFIEGRAFEQETPLLHEAARRGWPVEVDFLDDVKGAWPELSEPLRIHYVSNHVDPVSRTVPFYLELTNHFREVAGDGEKPRRVWRFRPGQRVQLNIPYKELKDVFVLPAEAVARDGPETFVFRANGNVFDRKPVHVAFEDSRHAIVANDGSVSVGNFIAQNGAAQLQRALKAKAAEAAGHGHGHSHDH